MGRTDGREVGADVSIVVTTTEGIYVGGLVGLSKRTGGNVSSVGEAVMNMGVSKSEGDGIPLVGVVVSSGGKTSGGRRIGGKIVVGALLGLEETIGTIDGADDGDEFPMA